MRFVELDGGQLIGGSLAGTTRVLGPLNLSSTLSVGAGNGAPLLGTTQSAELTTAGAGTYTAALLLSGYIRRDPNGAARTDTSATGAQIDAAATIAVGQYWDFAVVNTGAATEDITFEGDTGVTGATGTASIGTVEDGETAWFRILKTAAETFTVTQLSN